jgi:hypothetical protein
MTGPYEWNPMPHQTSVTCIECDGLASFEFAEVLRIEKKEDVPYFQDSPLFDYQFVQGGIHGNWHAAFYFHGLHRRSLEAVSDLPARYSPHDWDHSQYLYRSHGLDLGTLSCRKCGLVLKHKLSWPTDAYYQADIRGETLWAFNRESLIALRNYVAATDRKKLRNGPWSGFLLKVPTNFLRRNVRSKALKQIDRLLATT